jgi:hypothetical protein
VRSSNNDGAELWGLGRLRSLSGGGLNRGAFCRLFLLFLGALTAGRHSALKQTAKVLSKDLFDLLKEK